jgi:hypothetical protein
MDRVPVRHGLRLTVIGLVVGLITTVAGTAHASALRTSDAFADQARTAGLSQADARDLQSRVDGYLAKTGGTQIGLNEIRYAGGATLLLTLPGERVARRVTTSFAEPQGCPPEFLCAYQSEYLQGDLITAYYCGVDVPMPWWGPGSWVNNQTSGTRALFLHQASNVIGPVEVSAPAYSQSFSYNWTPIYYIQACGLHF